MATEGVIVRSYKYRLYPTKVQEQTLEAWQRACHQVQFVCILQRRMAWKQFRRGTCRELPNWGTQAREVTGLRNEYSWIGTAPSDVTAAIVKRVDDAYKRMREDRRNGKFAEVRWKRYPHEMGLQFRGQERYGTRMMRSNDRYGWWLLAGAIRSLGELKVRMHRQLPKGAEPRQVHITRAADGWYISFACDIPEPDPLPPADRKVVGVDLGCIHEGDEQRIAVTSDGRIFTVPDELKRNLKRLATLQKLVSPKRSLDGKAKAAQPDSKRTQRRRKRIAKLHQTIARQRRHHLDYIARMLCESADVIVFEDIDWRALRAKGGSRKKGLNRSMGAAAPGLLRRLTEERAEFLGRLTLNVTPYRSSQDCNVCGARGESKDLSVREWQCTACEIVHDRDENAAKNLELRGLRILNGG